MISADTQVENIIKRKCRVRTKRKPSSLENSLIIALYELLEVAEYYEEFGSDYPEQIKNAKSVLARAKKEFVG